MNHTNKENTPLLSFILLFMDIFGFNPLKNDSFVRLRCGATIIILTVYIFELFFGVFKLADLGDISFDMTLLVGIELSLCKTITISLNREALKNLIIKIEAKYWKSDRYEKDLHETIQKGYKFLKKTILTITISYILLFITVFLNPTLMKTKTLPYALYHVPTANAPIKQYVVAHILQSIWLVPAGISIYIFPDFFFITLIIYNINQLKLIKRGYLRVEATGAHLNELVRHHALILDSINEVNNIYYLYMTNVLLCTTLVIVSTLINIIMKGFPPSASSILMIFFFLSTFCIFCFLGNLVSSESQSVVDSIYQCGWWKKSNICLRKQLILVLMRSQKPAKLTAGNLHLDFSAFTQFVRATLNFFMFARALINKSK